MILKKLHEEYGFNIEPLLIKEAKRLGLSTNELSVLLVLISNTSKKKIFSFNSINKKVDFSSNELGELIEQLTKKEFVKIKLETHNKRDREIYELDGTYQLITNLFIQDEKEKVKEESLSNVSDTIYLLEEKFGRMLKSDELERVRTWYEVYKFEHNLILLVIPKLKPNSTLIYAEKLLNLEHHEAPELDSKTASFLDDLYKRL